MQKYWLTFVLLLFSFVIASCTSNMDAGNCEPADDSSNWPGLSLGLPIEEADLGLQLGEPQDVTWVPRADPSSNMLGVHYEGEREEALTWGPKNFTIDPVDGTFWIADTPGNQILHVDPDGGIIDVLDASKDAVGAVMAAVNESEIAVISVASQSPRVLRYDLSGELLVTYNLPMEWQGSVTGIEISDESTITVQREHGYRRHSILAEDDSQKIVDAPGITWDLKEPSEFDRFVIDPVDSRNTISA